MLSQLKFSNSIDSELDIIEEADEALIPDSTRISGSRGFRKNSLVLDEKVRMNAEMMRKNHKTKEHRYFKVSQISRKDKRKNILLPKDTINNRI